MRTQALILCLLAAGCGTAPPVRAPIEGRVVFLNGQPLPAGTIRFVPLDGGATPAVFTDISDGQYRLEADKGPGLGKHRIEITAMRKSAQKVEVQDGPPGVFQEIDEQYLPPRYNIDSVLVIDVVAGQNKKDVVLGRD
jgi:hypothetical protein